MRARALRHKEIVERVRLDLLQLANLLLVPANRVGASASAKSDERQGDEADQRSNPANRRSLNHPTALKRRYEATHRVAETKGAAPKLQKVAHEQEVAHLKAAVEMRGREVEWLKTKPAEDGSLFDIAKTKPDQIARIVLENVGLARTRNIRNALAQGD